MAWNEPGGRGESPWGRRPSNQGGLDGLLASLQRRLESLLRGGSGGSNGAAGGGGEGNGQLALLLTAAVLVLWLAAGFFKRRTHAS